MSNFIQLNLSGPQGQLCLTEFAQSIAQFLATQGYEVSIPEEGERYYREDPPPNPLTPKIVISTTDVAT